MRSLGITFLVAAALTLVWLAICPSYYRTGDYVREYRGGSGYQTDPREKTDGVVFLAGEMVLLFAVAGGHLLRPDFKKILAPRPAERPDTERLV
ncbi:MAG TPA: hypothetical protein VF624_01185 [Tepidisphaeraceae bacterium]|jgi:hypothetical protein